MTTDKTAATADGTDAVTYTVTVKNASGQAVAGQTVSLSTDLGTLSAQSGTTDANGQVKVTLTSTAAGSATVTATAAGQNLTAPVVSFSAEVFTPTVTTDKTAATADGTDAIIYTVTVKNASGQPVAGQAVSLSTDLGTLSAQSGTTDANGQVKVTLTSTTAGSATVTATAAGQNLTAPVVSFTAEVFTPTVTTDKTAATADGTDTVTYTVTVKNASGQAVAGQTVSLSTNLGTLSAQSSTTDANGQVKVTLTSTAAGSATVTATAAGQNLTAPVVTFTAEVFTPTVTTDKTTAVADGTDTVTYTVTVKNSSGQVVAGQAVSLSTDLGTLSAQSGTTDANGQVKVTLTSTAAGSATVTANAAGQNLTAPVVTFTAEVFTTTITVDKTTVKGDALDMATYTVTVKDAANQPVSGKSISWNTDFGTLHQPSTTTDANGQAQVKLYSRIEGPATVTASVVDQTLTAPVVEFTKVYNMVLVYDKQFAHRNGVDPITFTLTLTDGKNQPAAGVTVNWSTNFGDLTSFTGVTDANGVLQVQITGSSAGFANVVATVGDQSVTGSTVTFTSPAEL